MLRAAWGQSETSAPMERCVGNRREYRERKSAIATSHGNSRSLAALASTDFQCCERLGGNPRRVLRWSGAWVTGANTANGRARLRRATVIAARLLRSLPQIFNVASGLGAIRDECSDGAVRG